MKSKKILIIVIIIILVLAVAGAIFAYLYMATDTFKSNKELFAKYMNQNIEMFQNLTNLKTKDVYENLKNEDKYESNTDIKITYSEGGEISNPFNNLSAKLIAQKDNSQNYLYIDGQILFEDEEYLENEIIKDQGLYGIRFSDVAKQFITIKNDENLEAIANSIGIDSIQLDTIMDIMDGSMKVSEEVISDEEAQTLKEKYLNIIYETISNGTFEKQKKSMITYNNATTNTTAYMATLSSTQVEELLLQVLNNLKNDISSFDKFSNIIDKNALIEQIDSEITSITEEKEIPAIKIVLYEQNKKLLRTEVEIGTNKITIENVDENGEQKSNIKLQYEYDSVISEYEILINKKSTDNQETFEIVFEDMNEGKNYTITLLSEMQMDSSNITLKSSVLYNKDILTAGVTLDNIVNIGTDFEKKQTLNERNNVTLNNSTEENRKNIIEALKINVPEKFKVRLNLLENALQIKNDGTEQLPGTDEMTQVDINKFNAKFEFYVGESVSPENVKVLLNIAKDNLKNAEITQIEDPENENTKPEDIKYSIKLNIEKGITNEADTNKVLEKISDKKKYKVSITYNELNGLINSINIDEAES